MAWIEISKATKVLRQGRKFSPLKPPTPMASAIQKTSVIEPIVNNPTRCVSALQCALLRLIFTTGSAIRGEDCETYDPHSRILAIVLGVICMGTEAATFLFQMSNVGSGVVLTSMGLVISPASRWLSMCDRSHHLDPTSEFVKKLLLDHQGSGGDLRQKRKSLAAGQAFPRLIPRLFLSRLEPVFPLVSTRYRSSANTASMAIKGQLCRPKK